MNSISNYFQNVSKLFLRLLFVLSLASCGASDPNATVQGPTNQVLDEGYWDEIVPSIHTDKVDTIYLQQTGSNIAGKESLGSAFTGTIVGSDVTLSFPGSARCPEYAGVLANQTITGQCTSGTFVGLQINYRKSSFHITNFAPGDILATLNPRFAWTASENADSYLVRVMRDNASGDCGATASCPGIWEINSVATTDILFNSDDTASEALQPGILYRVNVLAFSAGSEIDQTMDVRFQVENGAITSYDNSSFAGPWFLFSDKPGSTGSYIVSDGNGDIIDFSIFNGAAEIAATTYSVSTDGTLTLSGPIAGTGQLTSATTGNFVGTAPFSFSANLEKVIDISSLQGSWSGTLTEYTPPNTSYNVTITVDANGEITAINGFASPVSGKLYSQGGNVVGFVRNAEPANNPYNQFVIDGGLLNGNTIDGTYSMDNGIGVDGTVNLTKMM